MQVMQSLTVTGQVQRLDFCRWTVDIADTYANAFENVWFTLPFVRKGFKTKCAFLGM